MSGELGHVWEYVRSVEWRIYVWSLQFEYSPYIWCVASDTKSCDSNIPVKRLLHLANLVLWWSIVSVHWRWRIDQNKFVFGTDLLMVYYTVALAIVGWNLTDGLMQLHFDHVDGHQTRSKSNNNYTCKHIILSCVDSHSLSLFSNFPSISLFLAI